MITVTFSQLRNNAKKYFDISALAKRYVEKD
jgi:hypothetical protein